MAAALDWGDVIARLIAVGYDPGRQRPSDERTPLQEAAFNGCQKALVTLLEAKVDVNCEYLWSPFTTIKTNFGSLPGCRHSEILPYLQPLVTWDAI